MCSLEYLIPAQIHHVPANSVCILLKGRPKGVKEQDVYICDYRLDKSAHLFYKIHRNRFPVCTKPYAFNHFPKRLTPKRDFSVRATGLLSRDLLLIYKH